jgi:hypothetical protein
VGHHLPPGSCISKRKFEDIMLMIGRGFDQKRREEVQLWSLARDLVVIIVFSADCERSTFDNDNSQFDSVMSEKRSGSGFQPQIT